MTSNPVLLPNLRNARSIALAGCLGLLVFFGNPLSAADGSAESPGAASEFANTNNAGSEQLILQLRARLAQAESELNRVRALKTDPPTVPAGATPLEAVEYEIRIDSLVRSYQQQLDEIARLSASQRRLEEGRQAARSWTGFAQPPPYSVLLVDDLRDSVEALSAKIQAGEGTLQLLEKFSANARDIVAESDRRLRLINEKLENASEPTRAERLTWEKTFERARNTFAAANVGLHEARRRRFQLDLADAREQLMWKRRQLAVAAQHTRFPQSDLDQVLRNIDGERKELETELTSAELEREQRFQALTEARVGVKKLLDSVSTSSPNDAQRSEAIQDLQAQVALRTARFEAGVQHVMSLRTILDAVVTQRALWQIRFEIFGTGDPGRLREAYRRIAHVSDIIDAAKPHFVQEVNLAAELIAEQKNRIQTLGATSAGLAPAREWLECYIQREQVATHALRNLEKLDHTVRRWKQALDQDRQSLPFAGRVRDLFGDFSSFGQKLWQFELLAAEDTVVVDGVPVKGRRSVTIGKLFSAFLILAAGYWLSFGFTRVVERLLVRRFRVEPNQANLIRRWARVTLVLALVVFSLVLVKIPLTVFAFLGGALAIGLGFGTQNLLKNFISGIIILFERPFRVGDVLDIEGRRGTVTGIGIRSSVLQLWDGTETLIPNSLLLEKNLTNWTYSNRKVRFSVKAGVAYGSDPRRVQQLLAAAAERHGLVQREPAPQVYFQDFGEKTLVFELRYWVDVLQHNGAQIASDLRHMIATSFAENGIVMTFPLAAAPLQVNVVRSDAAPGSGLVPREKEPGTQAPGI